MSLETKIFEGTWEEAMNHAVEIPLNQKVSIYVSDSIKETLSESKTAYAVNSDDTDSLALIDSWIASAPSAPEAIQEAEEDLKEFMRNINAERKRVGAPLVYPEV